MYRYLDSFGPQVGGTVLSSTSAGSGAPTEILSLTLTGATRSFDISYVYAMSAMPPKADMCGATEDVCFGPIADMRWTEVQLAVPCPLWPDGETFRRLKEKANDCNSK